MIKVILWDVDGTLLDISAAERRAMRHCFSKFCLGELSDEQLLRYSQINANYWRRLEAGELTKPEVLRGRFEDFFGIESIVFDDFDAYNGEYQIRLGDTVCFNDDADRLLKSLKDHVKQYAVTNGTLVAQERKLKRSGLIDLFDGVFISELMGTEKPNIEFFDKVFDKLGDVKRCEVLIVGDSLTSDMTGGNNAGIVCYWYNLSGKPADTAKQYVQKWIPIVAASQMVKGKKEEKEFLMHWIDVVDYE